MKTRKGKGRIEAIGNSDPDPLRPPIHAPPHTSHRISEKSHGERKPPSQIQLPTSENPQRPSAPVPRPHPTHTPPQPAHRTSRHRLPGRSPICPGPLSPPAPFQTPLPPSLGFPGPDPPRSGTPGTRGGPEAAASRWWGSRYGSDRRDRGRVPDSRRRRGPADGVRALALPLGRCVAVVLLARLIARALALLCRPSGFRKGRRRRW